MIYDVKLRIAYKYASPAVGGRHLACLLPLNDADQTVQSASLLIQPAPTERLDRLDFFGNQVTEFSFRAPHDGVRLTMQARVSRSAPPPAIAASARMADLPQLLKQCRDVGSQSPLHCLSASLRVPLDPALTRFARAQVRPGHSVADTVLAVGQALHDHMEFDAAATTVDTPAAEAFAQARGVCQDFSHIMIAGLRGIGIPAGYVSGFLRTQPPPGKPRLEGADAMHAWVRAWCGPALGWLEFDPTNACYCGQDHIVVARGRDYADVAPIKGTMRISGSQKSSQAVDVIPVTG